MGSRREIQYQWRPLDRLKNEFRLMESLELREEDQFLTATLHNVSINDHSPFTGLSYSWGDRTDGQADQARQYECHDYGKSPSGSVGALSLRCPTGVGRRSVHRPARSGCNGISGSANGGNFQGSRRSCCLAWTGGSFLRRAHGTTEESGRTGARRHSRVRKI